MAIIYQGKFNPTTRALRSLCDLVWNALPDDTATNSLSKLMLDNAPFDYAFANAARNPVGIPVISAYEINRLAQCPNFTLTLTTDRTGFENHFEAAKGDPEKGESPIFLRGITENRILYRDIENKEVSILVETYQGDDQAKALSNPNPSTAVEFKTKVFIQETNISGKAISYGDLIQVILHEVMAHVMPFCDFAYQWDADVKKNGSKDLAKALHDEMDTALFEHRCLITNGPVAGKENHIIKRYLNAAWMYYVGCSAIRNPNDPLNPNKDRDETWRAFNMAQKGDFDSVRKRCKYGADDKDGRDWFKISMNTVDAYNLTPDNSDDEEGTT